MNNKELAQALKKRFPPNVVQFHTQGEGVEVRPTHKQEVLLELTEDAVILKTQEGEEITTVDYDDDVLDHIEKSVRTYILS